MQKKTTKTDITQEAQQRAEREGQQSEPPREPVVDESQPGFQRQQKQDTLRKHSTRKS